MKPFISSLIILIAMTTTASAKTFVYCSEGSPVGFNPQMTTDGTSNNAAAHTIYNRLVDFVPGTTDLMPSLAERYTVSSDQLTYDFYLRPNVQFHTTSYFKPTRPLNSDDVLFSFERMKNATHPFHKVNGGSYEYFVGMNMGELIASMTKVSDLHIRIQLTKPEAPFLANMAMSFMSILSKEYGDQLIKNKKMEQIDLEPVGTGPFAFRRYRRDAQIRFERHPQYWAGITPIENLVIAITPEASVRFQKLRTGECHVMIEPAPSDLEAIKKEKDLTLLEAPGFNIGYLAMNTQKAPFDNVLVRQAIHHALNRQSYIDAIYLGHASVAKNPIPPTLWSYHENLKDLDYNPKRAKELLTQAGFKDGFEAELWTLPVTRPYNPAGRKMGEMMQADLAQVGIRLKLVSYDWPTYLAKSREGEHSMIQLGWTGDNGDPDNFFHTLLGCDGVVGGSNVAKWCHPEFNDLIMKAKQLNNKEERAKLYKKAQEIFKREAPWVTIAHSKLFRAKSNKVTGYDIDPLGGDKFSKADLK